MPLKYFLDGNIFYVSSQIFFKCLQGWLTFTTTWRKHDHSNTLMSTYFVSLILLEELQCYAFKNTVLWYVPSDFASEPLKNLISATSDLLAIY